VTGEQVAQVLGDDEIAQIAAKLGVSQKQAADALAEVLPQVVDKASPDRELRPQAELDQALAQLQHAAAPA
jgi:uncharacterized protein YidB (DUF937 family)